LQCAAITERHELEQQRLLQQHQAQVQQAQAAAQAAAAQAAQAAAAPSPRGAGAARKSAAPAPAASSAAPAEPLPQVELPPAPQLDPPELPKYGGLAGLLVKAGAQALVLDTGSLGAEAEREGEAAAEAEAEVEAEAGGAPAAPAERPSPLHQLMAWLGAPRCPSRSSSCAGGSRRATAEALPSAADAGGGAQHGAASACAAEAPVGLEVNSRLPGGAPLHARAPHIHRLTHGRLPGLLFLQGAGGGPEPVRLVCRRRGWCEEGAERQQAALQRYLLGSVMPCITRALAEVALSGEAPGREQAVQVGQRRRRC
jgi:hypothetical protein